MRGDFSRLTFDKTKHYSGVVWQQGRVQLDADLNEEHAIREHRDAAEAVDVIGWSGAPKYDGGFQISVLNAGSDLGISPGRMYVDGLLCVNEGTAVNAHLVTVKSLRVSSMFVDGRTFEKGQWIEIFSGGGLPRGAAVTPTQPSQSFKVRIASVDPSTSLLKFKPALAPEELPRLKEDPLKAKGRTALKVRRISTFLEQPDYWPEIVSGSPALPVPKNGKYLVYLDAWERYVTSLDDHGIAEKALGGADTAGRLKAVWQVKLLEVPDGADCSQFGRGWRPASAVASGKLNVRPAPADLTTDPCQLPPQSGYKGLENQLYRVEIHRGGTLGQDNVTFKWSKDNGSAVTAIEKISGSQVTVDGLGPDEALGITGGHWAEILDDRNELHAIPDASLPKLLKILTTHPDANTVDLESAPVPLAANSDKVDRALHPKLRQWDSGEEKAEIPPTNEGWLKLAGADGNGVEIKFTPGTYRSGDYWLVAARTAGCCEIGGLEWPRDADNKPLEQPPLGIKHHYAPLAIIDAKDGRALEIPPSDCRRIFPPLIEVPSSRPTSRANCCTFMVGDGVNSHGDFDDVGDALRNLPQEGGQLCLLPGTHATNVVIHGRVNVTVTGCGLRTKVCPKASDTKSPIFRVVNSKGIVFKELSLIALRGTAISLEEDQAKETGTGHLTDVKVMNNRILAYENAVRLEGGERVTVSGNKIMMLDRRGGGVALFLAGKECFVERNEITLSRSSSELPVDVPDPDVPDRRKRFDPHDECADFDALYKDRASVAHLADKMWETPALTEVPRLQAEASGSGRVPAARALGGIQVAAGSQRILILQNRICGGGGNGISLGGWTKTEKPGDERTDVRRKQATLEHAGGMLQGFVSCGGEFLKDIQLEFARDAVDRTRVTTPTVETVEKGYFKISGLARGTYTVSVMTPGYRIESVTTDTGTARTRRIPIVLIVLASDPDVASADRTLARELAPLRDIQILENCISRTGLSGIGTARVDLGQYARMAGRTTHTSLAGNTLLGLLQASGAPLIDVSIQRNRITECFQSALDETLKAEVMNKGVGGISLGMCERASITGNRIERNGGAPKPTTGVFVGYGEHLDVALNHVLDNGASTRETYSLSPESGVRGGIVLRLVSCVFDARTAEDILMTTGRELFAARIHDNVVSQPVGRALTVGALGPVSVQGNYFASQSQGPGQLNEIANTVLVVNVGRPRASTARAAKAKAVLRESRATTASASSGAAATTAAGNWPSGTVLFSDNQSRVGSSNDGACTHVVFSGDDVGFEGNQIDCVQRTGLFCNSVVVASTARAVANRFKELGAGTQVKDTGLTFPLSLLCLTRASASTRPMNTTVNNQGDHCVIAVAEDPTWRIAEHNLPPSTTGICARNELTATNASHRMAAHLK